MISTDSSWSGSSHGHRALPLAPTRARVVGAEAGSVTKPFGSLNYEVMVEQPYQPDVPRMRQGAVHLHG
jgi:hypothetical protein